MTDTLNYDKLNRGDILREKHSGIETIFFGFLPNRDKAIVGLPDSNSVIEHTSDYLRKNHELVGNSKNLKFCKVCDKHEVFNLYDDCMACRSKAWTEKML